MENTPKAAATELPDWLTMRAVIERAIHSLGMDYPPKKRLILHRQEPPPEAFEPETEKSE
jgi:hypothetical protein